jgi:hypothetical protein
MMKQIFRCLGSTILFVLLTFSVAFARNWNLNVNTHGEISSCDSLDIYSDEGKVARSEETVTAPNSPSGLHLKAGERGGVVVRGSDRQDYAVKVCKAATARDQSAAEALLRQISVNLRGDELVTEGPQNDEWLVYLIVDAPKNGNLRAETTNGPLSFHDFQGKATVQAKNGPISFKNCSGEINAEVQNGPVSVKGGAGDLHLKAQNGPLSVELAGNSWSGAGLEASTVNGPLSLKLPESYQSGVRVEMSGHSPVRCKAKLCEQANRNWGDEDQKSIQFNGSNPVVKMSTVNGPVSISDRLADY